MPDTGKVQYAPDYKSVRRDSKGLPIDDRGWPIMEVVDYNPVAEKAKRDEQSRVAAERSRLEKAVVEAAKAYGRAAQAVADHMDKTYETDEDSKAGWRLLREMESTQEDLMLEAIKPLLEFESQQGE